MGGPKEKWWAKKNFSSALCRKWAPHFQFASYAPEVKRYCIMQTGKKVSEFVFAQQSLQPKLSYRCYASVSCALQSNSLQMRTELSQCQ